MPYDSKNRSLNSFHFALLTTGAFAGVVLFGLLHHEMWRDELQAWLVARDAHSIPGLLKNMRYEGNPALWHFFLFLITIFTHNPVYMQALHFIIACGFIFVFNRYSELGRPVKIMFSFGYFTLYEYSVISRSYGLALLLIIAICTLYKNRTSRYILLGVLLALLANVTVYGMIFSFGFSAILLLDYILMRQKDNGQLQSLLAGMAIAAAGVACSVWQILPQPDNSFPINYARELFQASRWGAVWSKIFVTYFYVPYLDGINFWNTNWYFTPGENIQEPFRDFVLAHANYLWVGFILPPVVFLLCCLIFMRKPLVLILYTLVTLGLLSIYYYTNLLYCRYCGFLLIILIVCYWLGQYYPDKKYRRPLLNSLAATGKKIQKPFLIAVLAVNIIGAAVAYSKDYTDEFSVSKEVADYIVENKLDKETIAGAYTYIVSPLAAYLDTQVYFFQNRGFGSFCKFDGQMNWQITDGQIVGMITELMNEGRTKLLLVSSYQWKTSADGVHFTYLQHGIVAPGIKIDFLKAFDGGIVEDEKYYLYQINK